MNKKRTSKKPVVATSNAKNPIQTKPSTDGKDRSVAVEARRAVGGASTGRRDSDPKEPLQWPSNQQSHDDLPKVLSSIALQMTSYAVIGTAIGLISLALYAVGRNAIPKFSGDEWIPQLAILGLFCGLFVAVFASIPVLERLVHTTAIGPLRDDDPLLTDRDRAKLRKPHLNFVVQQVCAGFIGAVAFAVFLVVWGVNRPDSNVLGPSLAFLFYTAVCLGFPRLIDQIKPDWSVPKNKEIVWLSGFAHWVHLLWLVGLIWVLTVRYRVDDSRMFIFLVLTAVSVFTAYRFISQVALILAKSVKAIVALATVLSGVVVAVLCGSAMRMAAMGNLPHVPITLEAPLACKVLKHLHAEELKAAHLDAKQLNAAGLKRCQQSSADQAGELLTFEVDVVNLVGSSYTVAKAGDLEKFPEGKCHRVHGSAGRNTLADKKNIDWFPCAEFPNDANKVGLR
jgi:hypothetical protein